MNSPQKHYVLDTFALLAYVRGEKGGEYVRQIILNSIEGFSILSMSVVNLGEAFYIHYKKDSPQKAGILWRNVPRMGIHLYPATMDRTLAAAQLKAQYSTSKMQVSYADCYAAALAQEFSATVLTADPEFEVLADVINIQFLPK